jgi:hypothetical protein
VALAKMERTLQLNAVIAVADNANAAQLIKNRPVWDVTTVFSHKPSERSPLTRNP